MHFYRKRGKFMVQPGMENEKHLMWFLRLFPALCPSASSIKQPMASLPPTNNPNVTISVSEPSSTQTDPATQSLTDSANRESQLESQLDGRKLIVDLRPLSKAVNAPTGRELDDTCSYDMDEKHHVSECDIPTSGENNVEASPVPADSNTHSTQLSTSAPQQSSLCSNLVVTLPPLMSSSATNTNSVDSSDMSSQTDRNSIIIDELLFFLQNKLSMRPLPLNMLTRVCANFYTDDVISSSKRLLFQTNKSE